MSNDPNDPFYIPPALRREPAKASRQVSPEVEHKREAHRIAVSCRKLLGKDRKRKARG